MVFPSGGVQHASTEETGLFVVSTQRGVVLVTTVDPGALVATLVLIHAAHRVLKYHLPDSQSL